MERNIVNFHADDQADWVAELECGHNQHVRHRPPFQTRPWVLDESERAAHVGAPIDCPLCDRSEMPEGLRFAWRSAEWDARSLPTGLRRAHRLGSRTWGRLVVTEGSLAYRAATAPPTDCVLRPGVDQAIPPGVEHAIEPADDARFFIQFFDVAPSGSSLPPNSPSRGKPGSEP